MSKKAVAAVIALFAVIAAGFLLWPRPQPIKGGDRTRAGSGSADGVADADQTEGYRDTVRSMAEFQRKLAASVQSSLGDANDVLIVPATYEVPVGTLFRPSRQFAADDESCVPPMPPTPRRAASLLPDYDLASGVAASIGLDNGVVAGLAEAGATVDRNRSVALRFEDVRLSFLNDSRFGKLVATPACLDALHGGPYLMLRGYIEARRAFVFGASGKAGVKAGTRIGSFEVTRNAGDAKVELADAAPAAFLSLLTQVDLVPAAVPQPQAGPDPTALPDDRSTRQTHRRYSTTRPSPPGPPTIGGTTPPPLKVSVSRPSAAAGRGKVYVQRDAADRAGAADAVVRGLVAEKFRVAAEIEAVPSGKMPRVAQVRYFNAADAATAGKALRILQRSFPTATLVEVPLPAPSGQLEVWLPRTGG